MKHCAGELLHRVRQGVASPQEQTAFEAHLGTCESCRMTIDVMGDLDAVGEPQPGDWERVAKFATAGVSAFGKNASVPRPFVRRPWQLALAALVLTGAAAAGVAVTTFDGEKPRETEAPASQGTAPESAPAPLPTQPIPTAEPVGEAAPDSPPEESKPTVRGETTAPARSPAAPSPATWTAADAYRLANDARRAGRTSEAIEGYRQLQRKFPGSAEAHASRVSLGGLLLRSGSAGAALVEFDAYLSGAGGQLTAEALFGRAQSLRALGRSAEEAHNLKRLVSSYPNSAYATHAKRRLAELR